MSDKFIKALPELIENNIVSEETALKIEQYFNSKAKNEPNRLFMVFGVLGSLLIGLGLILILAHNWDSFSKAIKTMFAFAPLLIGQALVGYSILKEKSQVWKESSGVFLFFAVGASMALVSQIYNIPGNFSSYLLIWMLLCLPLIYLLKSNALVMLHLVFATNYACNYGYFSSSKTPWLYLLLIVLILPYYYSALKKNKTSNSVSVMHWLLPISIMIALGGFLRHGESLTILMYVMLFGLFYNIGKLPYFVLHKLRSNGYLVIGSLGTVITLLFATFKWFWFVDYEVSLLGLQEFYIALVLGILALSVLVYNQKEKTSFNLFQYIFAIFVVLFVIGLYDRFLATVLANVLVFVLGIIAIKIGADKFHFGVLNYGLLIVTVLITCRFFDTNMSFVIRGLLFVVIGVGFFATNYMMLKKKKQ